MPDLINTIRLAFVDACKANENLLVAELLDIISP